MNGFGQPSTMYTFGGGNFPTDFNVGGKTYSTWQMGARGPELSPMAKQLGVQVLPTGATSRQELRYLKEEAQRSGRPYVEAPIKAELRTDQKGIKRYVNPATGQSVGTLLGSGSYKEFGQTTEWRRNSRGDLIRPTKKLPNGEFAPIPERMRGGGPQPAQQANIPQTTPSPIPSGTTMALTSFGGIPSFPFAG